MSFKETMEHVVQGFEALGVAVLIIGAGAGAALVAYVTALGHGRSDPSPWRRVSRRTSHDGRGPVDEERVRASGAATDRGAT